MVNFAGKMGSAEASARYTELFDDPGIPLKGGGLLAELHDDAAAMPPSLGGNDLARLFDDVVTNRDRMRQV